MVRLNKTQHGSRLRRRTAGQGLVEYALVLLLVALVVIVILVMLGPQIGSVFSGVSRGMLVDNTTPYVTTPGNVVNTPTPCVTQPGVGNIGRCR